MSDNATTTLDEYKPQKRGPTNPMQFEAKRWDRESIGGPLDNRRFLKDANRRNYDGADVAELFDDLTAIEADRALSDEFPDYSRSIVEIGDEQFSLNRHH